MDLIEGKKYRLVLDTEIMSSIQAVDLMIKLNQSSGIIIDTYIGKKFKIIKALFQEVNPRYLDVDIEVLTNPLPVAVVLYALAILAGLSLFLLILVEVNEITDSPAGTILIFGIAGIAIYYLLRNKIL
jgi:hypothetical protein